MKSRYKFEIMNLDDGLVAVPVGEGAQQFQGVLKVNETAMAILKMLENDITEEEIVDNLLIEYTGDREQISVLVHEYLDKLLSEDVIVNK